jgi:hypothetical protein
MPRRDRVRRRSAVAKWVGRVLGLIGTGAVLAAGAITASMVLATGDEDVVDSAPAATPTPEPRSAAKRDRSKLTAQQRKERRRAVDALRRQGYRPVDLADYKVDHLLRVLIGEPVGTTPPGPRAFCFVDGEYIGLDATSASGKLRPGRQLEREITLVYTLYRPGDERCCPKGKETRVHFRWNGESLQPREPIPPPAQRLPPG